MENHKSKKTPAILIQNSRQQTMKVKREMMDTIGQSGHQTRGNGITVDCLKMNGVFGKTNTSAFRLTSSIWHTQDLSFLGLKITPSIILRSQINQPIVEHNIASVYAVNPCNMLIGFNGMLEPLFEPSTNQFGQVAWGYPITHPTLKNGWKGLQWVDTDARQCTGGLNTHCTLP